MSRKVHAQLTKLLDQAEEIQLEDHKDPARFFFMRPSGFPYCGLRKLLEAPKFFDDERLSTLASSYFTGVGTAAHTTFQRFLGRSNYIVGNWKCPKCKDVKKFTTFCRCKECKIPREYEELEIYYRNTTVGHTDGLLRLEPDKGKKSKHYVIDYKTSAYYKTRNKKQVDKTYPLRSNVQQIKMYIVLLEAMYGITVDGYALIYLGRDLPLGKNGRHLVVVEVSEEERRKCRKTLDRWVKLHRRVLKVTRPDQVEVIKKYKLCSSFAHYRKEVEDEYNPCSIAPFCFNEKLLNKKIEKTLQHEAFPLIDKAPIWIQKIIAKKDEET